MSFKIAQERTFTLGGWGIFDRFFLKSSVCPEWVCHPFSSISENSEINRQNSPLPPLVCQHHMWTAPEPFFDFCLVQTVRWLYWVVRELYQGGSATNRAIPLVYQWLKKNCGVLRPVSYTEQFEKHCWFSVYRQIKTR